MSGAETEDTRLPCLGTFRTEEDWRCKECVNCRPATPRTPETREAETVCEFPCPHCGGRKLPSGKHRFIQDEANCHDYTGLTRTPETQGERIPEKWRPVYARHVALLDTDSLHICMLAEELGHAESRSRAILGLLRVKHPGDVALAEEIIDEGGR